MGLTWSPAFVSLVGLLASLAGLAGPLPAQSQGQTLPVAPAAPKGDGEPAATRRYKVKVSEGSAWTNLQPESWLIFDLTGRTVVARHSTYTVNAITGIGKWWEHPVTEIRACRLSLGQGGDPLAACVRGESPSPEVPPRVVLPPDVTIHDLLFRVRWRESGREREATTRVPSDGAK
jgi:hypothetical protein